MAQQLMNFSARAPGYMGHVLKQLKTEGKVDASVSADQIRSALKDGQTKLVAKPHAGIDLMVTSSQVAGNIYTQMKWTVIHAKWGELFTSDTPVSRRNPQHKGIHGGGIMSPTTEVWFPLSKTACLLLRHDAVKMRTFDELLETGNLKEAQSLRAELPPIEGSEAQRELIENGREAGLHRKSVHSFCINELLRD